MVVGSPSGIARAGSPLGCTDRTERVTTAGYAFISADYQLLPPATGNDIVKDVQDLLEFMISRDFKIGSTFRVDPNAIAVAGSSAGGLCAYLAAIHCKNPAPKAVVSLYGMGADYLTPHYLTPKTKPFFRGREILDPSDFTPYLHPNHLPKPASASTPDRSLSPFTSLEHTADSALAYHPQTYTIPGYPANPRMLLTRLYLQLGVFIDYYTGVHEDGGISCILREALPSTSTSPTTLTEQEAADAEKDVVLRLLVPLALHPLFPQLSVTSAWPPTFFMHGTHDTAVPVEESRALARRLRRRGVTVELHELEGAEHSFDYEEGAEQAFVDLFTEVQAFLDRNIGKAS
ncbi:hypothetical protein H0H81_005609 [Sphagnurus paluster]|uniref:Alpha/beta-hydrolase n=1 Tax=Sphagnurus paluster TaxID=117069 RepID=A0A9P7KH51_9AGAR|nr:hypothetical protein H0H81_005609 [Sphagnurus paluster]